MKRLFLLFGVCVAGSAAAQQKDLFDAEKHLQKKKMPCREIQMRPLWTTPELKQNRLVGLSLPKMNLSHLLADGSRVFILPVDNMPCVSPDMNSFHTMPNADKNTRQFIFRQRSNGQMPNPAAPFILITPK